MMQLWAFTVLIEPLILMKLRVFLVFLLNIFLNFFSIKLNCLDKTISFQQGTITTYEHRIRIKY